MNWQDKVRKRRIRNSQKHRNLKILSTTLESIQSSRSKKTGIKNQPTRLQDYKRVFSEITTTRLNKIYMYILIIVLSILN